LNIIPCTSEHLEELIQFVTRLNQDESHHIGYFGVGEAETRASLDECLIPPADSFQLAYENKKLIGIFGADADPEIGRAWLFGPIIEHEDWQNIADQLYTALQSVIPQSIPEYELFCDVKNINLNEFAERHNFSPRSDNAILFLLRENYQSKAKEKITIIDFETIYFDQFERLHNQVFPKTYFTAKQIVEKLDDKHHLLIAIDNERLLGYFFGKIESESGYVDFIAADESARGRGIGADLLAAGLHWMFAAPTTQRVNLTVNADNTAACSLYNKFGFTTERITRGYRKKINV
jgi:ribosomal protein S18 acetylase RimI-like enzyme